MLLIGRTSKYNIAHLILVKILLESVLKMVGQKKKVLIQMNQDLQKKDLGNDLLFHQWQYHRR